MKTPLARSHFTPGVYNYISYRETRSLAIRMACALRDLSGPQPGEQTFIGLNATNRWEWYLADMSCVLACGVVSVGVHTVWSPAERHHVIRHAGLQGASFFPRPPPSPFPLPYHHPFFSFR